MIKTTITSVILGLAWASVADAAWYRIAVESPLVVSDPQEAFPLTPLEFGTRVSSLDHISVQVSGIHSNGWWVGDGIEGYYVGPRGASLTVYLFPGLGIRIPGLPRDGWYEGTMVCTNDGAFSAALPLSPSPGYLVTVPYVADGRAALCCVTWGLLGFGGSMARQPYLALTQVEVQLEASPKIEITSARADGTVSWSALPPGGTVEILAATAAGGPWEVEQSLPSESRSARVQRDQADTVRFFRLRWREGGSP